MTVRLKNFEDEFYGLIVDEKDLTRFSEMAQRIADKYSEQIKIKVTSSDGEDVITSDDPSLFSSSQMIRKVKEVSISYVHTKNFNFREPYIDIHIQLRTPEAKLTMISSSKASIKVFGTDNELVTSCFYELQRELAELQTLPQWVGKFLNSFFGFVIFGLIGGSALALFVFSIFDFPLNLLATNVSGFHASSLHQTIGAIGWVCVLFGFCLGFWNSSSFLLRITPAVKFSGILSDSNSKLRKNLSILLVFIIIPIAINLISTFIIPN